MDLLLTDFGFNPDLHFASVLIFITWAIEPVVAQILSPPDTANTTCGVAQFTVPWPPQAPV